MRRAPVLLDTFFARRLDGDAGRYVLGHRRWRDCGGRLFASFVREQEDGQAPSRTTPRAARARLRQRRSSRRSRNHLHAVQVRPVRTGRIAPARCRSRRQRVVEHLAERRARRATARVASRR